MAIDLGYWVVKGRIIMEKASSTMTLFLIPVFVFEDWLFGHSNRKHAGRHYFAYPSVL